MRQRWSDFFNRLEVRVIRVLDVLSILAFDATLIGVGYQSGIRLGLRHEYRSALITDTVWG
jgi:hypothetical protein